MKKLFQIFFKYWIRPWAPFVLLFTPLTFADNEIDINQVGGERFDLIINQIGANNIIKDYNTSTYIEGDDITLHLVQFNDTSVNNVIQIWHLDGNTNTVRWAQGAAWDNSTSSTYSYDGDEGGGHNAVLDFHGTGNHIQGHQTNQGSTSGHNFESVIFSDYNDIWVRQQHDGAKDIDLTTYSDYNDITIRQKGNGANHYANIYLTGSDPTSLDLLQQGSTSQSYSLSQNCITAGGCTVTVTQGN